MTDIIDWRLHNDPFFLRKALLRAMPKQHDSDILSLQEMLFIQNEQKINLLVKLGKAEKQLAD